MFKLSGPSHAVTSCSTEERHIMLELFQPCAWADISNAAIVLRSCAFNGAPANPREISTSPHPNLGVRGLYFLPLFGLPPHRRGVGGGGGGLSLVGRE